MAQNFLNPISKRPPPLPIGDKAAQLRAGGPKRALPLPSLATARIARSKLSSSQLISLPRPELTVDLLAGQLTLEKLSSTVRLLQTERAGSCFTRPQLTGGEPGALVLHNGKRDVYVIGDLHGNKARLDIALKEIGPRLYSGEAELVFLGDLIHPENGSSEDNLRQMAPSREVLDAVVMLKNEFPDQIQVLLGNHDIIAQTRKAFDAVYDYLDKPGSTSLLVQVGLQLNDTEFEEIMIFKQSRTKDGQKGPAVASAIEYLLQLCSQLKAAGRTREEIWQVVSSYQSFYDACPLALIIEGEQNSVYLAHSGVVNRRVEISRAHLIEARSDPELKKQLLWNRATAKDFKKKYGVTDIDRTLRSLGIPNGYIISGHVRDTGGQWKHSPLPDPSQWIVHGNIKDSFGLVLISNGCPSEVDLSPLLTTAELKAVV